jgi:cyclopropane-fatty-acyl-phospholipid synthase
MAWYDNFAQNWPRIEQDYDERFYRRWSFAIRRAAGAFLSVNNPLWQIVLSKKGTVEGYTPIR